MPKSWVCVLVSMLALTLLIVHIFFGVFICMSEEIEASEVQLELYKFKSDTAEIFTGLSKAISSQMGVTVAITEQLNAHGLLPDGDDRKKYFSTVRKALADMEALNDILVDYFSPPKKGVVEDIAAVEKRLSDSE